MPVNKYFNVAPKNRTNEQRMYEDLLCESIRIQGMDVYYLPREDLNTTDKLFGENVQSYFERAYTVDMYLQNSEGWSGTSEFFSKFGLGSLDNATFVVAKRTFDSIVPSNIMIRPREGDLLYVPVMQKIFEITFVEEDTNFYTKGNKFPYTYELTVEAFRSSNEILKTGVPEIDIIDDTTSWTVELTLAGIGAYNRGERVFQGSNLTYSTANAKVSEWDGANNKIYLYEVIGQFEPSINLIGSTSNTIRMVSASDTMGDQSYYDLYDNKDIQLEANVIIDTTEINPFGAP